MTRRSRPPAAGETTPGDDPDPVTRRAPFSDNPRVGVRGQRTQQRILDAAIQVFGEQGYHQCSIDRITRVAGCSRVSFYQYFSGKDDLYRTLSGQVARQMTASIEALGPVEPTAGGWDQLRGWVERHAGIYERYAPVFEVFGEAAETDEAVAGGSARVSARNLARFCARLAENDVPARQLPTVMALLLESATRTLRSVRALRAAEPDAFPPERVLEATADVMHRTLFGRLDGINVHEAGPVPRRLDAGPVLRGVRRWNGSGRELTPGGQRTLDALVHAGQEVLVRRGFHRTRVDDIVGAAGVSHGAFYRYFHNKDELAHLVAVQAMRRVSDTFADLPDLAGDAPADRWGQLRSWLRRYDEAYSSEMAVIQVWVDASAQDPGLAEDSAAVVDWGRRRMAGFLRPRDFGDVETEGVVLLALLVALGARAPSSSSIDAAALVVERGFLAL